MHSDCVLMGTVTSWFLLGWSPPIGKDWLAQTRQHKRVIYNASVYGTCGHKMTASPDDKVPQPVTIAFWLVKLSVEDGRHTGMIPGKLRSTGEETRMRAMSLSSCRDR